MIPSKGTQAHLKYVTMDNDPRRGIVGVECDEGEGSFWGNTNSQYRPTRCRKAGQVLLAPRWFGTMTLFPQYFSEEVVLRMFHPADGENSSASLGRSVMRNGITSCMR